MLLHHCDEPACVRIDHLYEGTAADNARDRESRGRSKHRGPAKLTRWQVDELRRLREAGVRPGALAKMIGTSKQNVSNIIARRTWK